MASISDGVLMVWRLGMGMLCARATALRVSNDLEGGGVRSEGNLMEEE